MSKYGIVFRLLNAINTVVIRIPHTIFKELLFLGKSFHIMRSFDLLIISGGGQLTDWGGPWLFPYTIFKWVFLAKAAHVNCVFLNVGAGPLTQPLSRFFVTRALRSATYVSFRDNESRALVQQIGFRGRAHVSPDCVYSLQNRSAGTSDIRYFDKQVVGIAPMPYFDPRSIYPDKDQSAYDSFIRTLASFGSWLIRDNYSLALFCSDIGIDPPVIEDLRKTLVTHHQADARCITAPSVKSTDELLSAMSAMDYVVTCRFHGVVFAHLLNKPVLAVSHHPKVATLMEDLGLSEYCVDIRTRDVGVFKEAFLSLVANKDAIKSRMEEKLVGYKRELASQFDSLFAVDTL
jgi:polysaccharide pyruvyl transferase WcaK-like protein